MLDELQRIMNKMAEIHAINEDLIRIAKECDDVGTVEAKELSGIIYGTVLSINAQCKNILHKAENDG